MGGGCLAHLLKRRFRLTVSDISPAMLEVSQKFNPDCPHVCGDFRSMRLGAEFVAVIAEDAISYATTVEELSSVMTTAYEHCLEGGVAVFIPEFTAETFVGDTYAGGANTRDAGLRYMRWTYLLEPPDPGYESIFVYLTKQKDAIEVLHERHRFGLFPRETWLSLMREVGFEPELAPFDDGRPDMVQRDAFVGVKVQAVTDARSDT
jgi:trans-aconitate methyltransferase